ncbi:MAG TPA: hypothetical protein VK524_10485 [Polyangiaceae bacterium]|nr:hypothetical protein [Polyangiaceae bacterium]
MNDLDHFGDIRGSSLQLSRRTEEIAEDCDEILQCQLVHAVAGSQDQVPIHEHARAKGDRGLIAKGFIVAEPVFLGSRRWIGAKRVCARTDPHLRYQSHHGFGHQAANCRVGGVVVLTSVVRAVKNLQLGRSEWMLISAAAAGARNCHGRNEEGACRARTSPGHAPFRHLTTLKMLPELMITHG